MNGMIYLKKEEYIEDYNFPSFIKKEEDISASLEETITKYRKRTEENFSSNMVTIPCNKIKITLPCPIFNLNIYLGRHMYGKKWGKPKPFTIIKEKLRILQQISMEAETLSIPFIKVEPKVEPFEEIKIVRRPKNSNEKKKRRPKKIVGVSGSRNYIGLVSAGISRTIITAEEGSKVVEFLKQAFHQRKMKYGALQDCEDDELVNSFQKYSYTTMCGKKVKKSNKDRDFKVRNSEELDKLLTESKGDDDYVCLKKEVLREMVEYFFSSGCYEDWVISGSMKVPNRVFFMDNKEEIKKKFLDPLSYKPKFMHE